MKPDSWLIVTMYLGVLSRIANCYNTSRSLESAWRMRLLARYDLKDLRNRRGDGRGKMVWPLDLIPALAAELDPMLDDLEQAYRWLERVLLVTYNGKLSENNREFSFDECAAALDDYLKRCEAHSYRLLELAVEHGFENVMLD